MITHSTPSPVRRYARLSYQLLKDTYRHCSSFPRYRDVTLDCGIAVNIDMFHRNWHQVHQRGHHERDTERFISEFLRLNDQVIDVGAQIGMFSAVAAQLIGAKGHLHAFEPDGKNYGHLEHTVQRNQLHNVTLNPTGLSDQVGSCRFFKPDGAWGSFMDGGHGHSAKVTEKFFSSSKIDSYTHQTQTIDHYISEKAIDRLDLIKLDVDGPELTILRGAQHTLDTLQPAIIVEASMFYAEHGCSVEELFALLQHHHYLIYGSLRDGDSAQLMTSTADIPIDLSKKGAAMNFFCYVPGTYDERWKQLWFMQQQQ